MKRRNTTRILGCVMFSYAIFVLLAAVPAAAFTSMSDDFSSDSGSWQYVGNAHRTNGYIELVPAQSGNVGAAWLKQDVRYPFVVEFRAQASSSGEGMAFLFHHDKGYTPAGGGRLGAEASSGSVAGWAVELDMRNSGGSDTGAPHLALVQDPLGMHYKTDSSVNFNDNKWHTFSIEIEWSTIVLKFDGKEVWRFSDYSYKGQSGIGMGFSAASSGGSFRVDDFKLMKPGEAEMIYWVTFGVTVGAIFFGTLGGIVLWGSLKWRKVYKQYARPGVDYRAFKIDGNLQKQILAAAAHSPDPDMAKLRHGLRMTRVGMSVAGFLMMAMIFGTFFMPAFLVVTLGVVLMLIFIAIFGIAGYLSVRRAKPFLVLMGQRLGWIPPEPYGTQVAPPPGYMAPQQQQFPAPGQVPPTAPWQAPPSEHSRMPWDTPYSTKPQSPWDAPPSTLPQTPWQAPAQGQSRAPPPVPPATPWQAPPSDRPQTPWQAPPPVPPAGPSSVPPSPGQVDWGTERNDARGGYRQK